MAAIFAVGAMTIFAQDTCEDTEAQTTLGDKFRAEYPLRDIPGRKRAVETGKQFLEKYGACESAKDLSDYLKTTLPIMENNLKTIVDAEAKNALLLRFDTALKTKNWDGVYSSGKEVLQKYPDEFRLVTLVLGSIGLDETASTPRVTKWNDETLRFAKQAIADLEAGKEFKPTFGVGQFTYKNKEDALGWMNYTIGYIYFFGKDDKKQGLSYLYKSTQLASDTKSNPVVYQSIGAYYFDEVRKLAAEVDVMIKDQKADDAEDIAKQKVDAIKAKVALVNGTSEAAIDAYARALNLAKADPVKYKGDYTNSLNKILQDLYNVRFGKMTGFDAFVAATVKKPMPNPLDPVTPIADPEPGTTTTSSTTTTSTTPASTIAKPASGPSKPATSATTKSGTPKKQ